MIEQVTLIAYMPSYGKTSHQIQMTADDIFTKHNEAWVTHTNVRWLSCLFELSFMACWTPKIFPEITPTYCQYNVTHRKNRLKLHSKYKHLNKNSCIRKYCLSAFLLRLLIPRWWLFHGLTWNENTHIVAILHVLNVWSSDVGDTGICWPQTPPDKGV